MNWYKTSQQTPPVTTTPEKPDLVTAPDEIDAAKEFTEHYVIFRFNNGWTVQKVEKDIDVESNLLKVDAYPSNTGDEHLYSLRNEHNVPRANFIAQVSKKEPSYLGISEVNYEYVPNQKIDNEKYSNGLLKQFFDYLKTIGMKPKWINETSNTDSVGIRELKNYIVDGMGIPEFVYGKDSERHNFQIGGSSDSYYKALELAYSEAWGGSYYYSNVANGLIDDIFSFAEAREEVGLLENAVQKFEEWAFDMWCEADWGDSLPERPEEPTKEEFNREYKETPGQKEFKTKDFNKTKNTYFDEKAYNEAVKEYERLEKEYEEKEAELQESFEPYEFGNAAYKKLQNLKTKHPKKTPKNKIS